MKSILLGLPAVAAALLSAAAPRAYDTALRAPPPAHAARPPGPGVTLVVLIAVDQMRADYLSRFAAQWTPVDGRVLEEVLEHGATSTRDR